MIEAQPHKSHLPERAVAFIAPWEGSVNHMYLDKRGLVTVGIGCMLPDVGAALALPFVPHDAIRGDFAAVRTCLPGKPAPYYRQRTKATLPEPSIKALAMQHCIELTAALQSGTFPHVFQDFPEPAAIAVLDMAYNLGLSKLRSRFPRLIAAAGTFDWATCAKECHRQDVQVARNIATAALFVSAATGGKPIE